MEGQALYEVRAGESIVGPVTLDQIRRGRSAGKIPPSAEARAVGPWLPVERSVQPTDATSAASLQRASFLVRSANNVVGPVSFYQLRRGLLAGRIPAGSHARWVGPWALVGGLLATLGRSAPPQRPRASSAPRQPSVEDDEGPTLHRPGMTEPPDPQFWSPVSDRPMVASAPFGQSASFGPPMVAPAVLTPSTPPVRPQSTSTPPLARTGPTRPAVIIPEAVARAPDARPSPPPPSPLVATARVRPAPPPGVGLDGLAIPRPGYPRLRLFATGALFVLLLAFTGFGVVRCVLVRSAPQRAQNLFLKAEAAPEAATAIRLYAQSILTRTQYAEEAPEVLAEPRARIEARARKRVDELLRAGRVEAAKGFVGQIRPDLQAVGLDETLQQLDKTIAERRR